MKGTMADINAEGHLEILLYCWQSEYWLEVWEHLGLSVVTFEECGLNRESPDSVIWQCCQDRQLVLITANRNDDGPDSLEATIRDRNKAESLPVFTLADSDRLKHDAQYAARTAVKLLQYFLEIDNVRGTGQLYVP